MLFVWMKLICMMVCLVVRNAWAIHWWSEDTWSVHRWADNTTVNEALVTNNTTMDETWMSNNTTMNEAWMANNTTVQKTGMTNHTVWAGDFGNSWSGDNLRDDTEWFTVDDGVESLDWVSGVFDLNEAKLEHKSSKLMYKQLVMICLYVRCDGCHQARPTSTILEQHHPNGFRVGSLSHRWWHRWHRSCSCIVGSGRSHRWLL